MTKERTHRRWIVATCVVLVLAAIGDAGPEIAESHSLMANYDGPGPLIDLGLAAVVATTRWWRFAPLIAVAMSALFLVGGFANATFTGRLIAPHGVASVGAWLQMLSFVAAIVCGTASVHWRRSAAPSTMRRQQ